MAAPLPVLADFRARFPEFEKATDPLVNAKLAESARFIAWEVWGDLYIDGVYYQAAHLLSCAPYGQQSRLAATKDTTYGLRFEALRMAVTPRIILL